VATGCRSRQPVFVPPQGQRMFPLVSVSRSALGPT